MSNLGCRFGSALPFPLDQHAIRILAVIPADVRFYQMAAGKLRTMRAIEQVIRIVCRRHVNSVLSFATTRPGAQRGIVIQPEIPDAAIQEIGKTCQKLVE